MDPGVLAALIAAGTALFVSVVSALTVFVQTRATNRLHSQAVREQDDRLALRAAADQYRTAIRECCAAVQQFQDEIQLLVRGARGTLLSASARGRVFKARDNVLDAYQRHHSILDPDDRGLLFTIREKTIEIVLALDIAQVWSSRLLQITDDQIIELDRTIQLMSQHQQRLLLAAVAMLPVAAGRTDE